MENADRTINLLRKAVNPPEGVRTDFEILLDFAKRMGLKDRDGNPLIAYTTTEECFEEWKNVSRGRPCDMTGITYDKLEKYNGLRWPVNEEHPEGTTRLYTDFKFPTETEYTQSFTKHQFTGRPLTKKEYEMKNPNGRAILYPITYLPPAEQPTKEYPMWLTTGRLVWHWHTRTKTARSPLLHVASPQGYVEINEADAELLSLLPGELIRISSPRGWIEVPARIGNVVQKGLVFVPFHFGSWERREAANELTADFTDPLSKQPTFKQSACKIEKLRTQHIIAEEDTLQSLANQYGISVDHLQKANALTSPYDIQVGKILEIPASTINVPIPPYLPESMFPITISTQIKTS